MISMRIKLDCSKCECSQEVWEQVSVDYQGGLRILKDHKSGYNDVDVQLLVRHGWGQRSRYTENPGRFHPRFDGPYTLCPSCCEDWDAMAKLAEV